MGQNIKNFKEWQQINEGWWEDVVNFFTGGSSSANANTEKNSKDKKEKDKGDQDNIPTPGLDPEKEDRELARKNNFHLIPDKRPASSANYRSAQMSLNDLEYAIKKYGIKTVIRMNGDGSDTKTGVTNSEERKLCAELGCKFVELSAHKGYSKEKGYENSIKDANSILKQGNTLVHCNHGADRTGYIVAAYLKEIGAMTDLKQLWDYTTQYNGWKGYIKNGKFWDGYDKYAAGFIPYEELGKGPFT